MQEDDIFAAQAEIEKLQHSSFILEHSINSTILLFSYTMTITAQEAILMMIDCLQEKLHTNSVVACGAAKMNAVMDAFPDRLTKNSVKTIMARRKKEDQDIFAEFFSGDSVVAQTMRKAKIQPDPLSSQRSLTRANSQTEITKGSTTPKNMYGTENDEGPEDRMLVLKNTFGGCSEERYNEILEEAVDEAIIIKDPGDIKTVKFFSLSCGIQERYHGSAELGETEAQLKSRIMETARRVHGDCLPLSSAKIPPKVIAALNDAIDKDRTKRMKKKLRENGLAASGAKSLYVRQENILYFRDGINGRPDVILVSETGQPLGVVEVKSFSGDIRDKKTATAIRQLVLYHLMLQTQEAYLYIYPIGKARFSPVLIRVSDEHVQRVVKTIPNMKANQASFRQNALAHFKN